MVLKKRYNINHQVTIISLCQPMTGLSPSLNLAVYLQNTALINAMWRIIQQDSEVMETKRNNFSTTATAKNTYNIIICEPCSFAPQSVCLRHHSFSLYECILQLKHQYQHKCTSLYFSCAVKHCIYCDAGEDNEYL